MHLGIGALVGIAAMLLRDGRTRRSPPKSRGRSSESHVVDHVILCWSLLRPEFGSVGLRRLNDRIRIVRMPSFIFVVDFDFIFAAHENGFASSVAAGTARYGAAFEANALLFAEYPPAHKSIEVEIEACSPGSTT